eukprot:Gb_04090 [translate_table: standard]
MEGSRMAKMTMKGKLTCLANFWAEDGHVVLEGATLQHIYCAFVYREVAKTTPEVARVSRGCNWSLDANAISPKAVPKAKNVTGSRAVIVLPFIWLFQTSVVLSCSASFRDYKRNDWNACSTPCKTESS